MNRTIVTCAGGVSIDRSCSVPPAAADRSWAGWSVRWPGLSPDDEPPTIFSVTPQCTPTRLNLKKDEKLEIQWQDGHQSVYSISYLRSMCPCAQCKALREEQKQRKSLLRVLPGNYAQPLSAASAELVGNYAIRIEWSDEHGTGIYSFEYLRQISPP